MHVPISEVHEIRASAETVSVGSIDPLATPSLSIRSGDEVILSTWGNWGGKVTPAVKTEGFADVKALFPGVLGPHSLTGPIYVEGAHPGDSLVVEFLELVPDSYGYNMVVASPRGRGVLRDRFPDARLTHFELDRETMTTHLNGRVEIPLRPFLGIVGVSPPGDSPISSVEPGPFGGNIDFSELTEGTKIELPVFHEGAGFYCGDGHAAQGDGEINQMAIETGMERVHLRFTLKKATDITTPRAESSDHWYTLGFGHSLEEAAREAVEAMVDFLAAHYDLTPEDSYTLCSISAHLRVTQMVNGIVGMHVKMPKL